MISTSCSRKAPEDKFRIIGIDLFDHTGWNQGDYDTLKEAIEVANENCDPGNTDMHIHDEDGRLIYDANDYFEDHGAFAYKLSVLQDLELLSAEDALTLMEHYQRLQEI